MKHWLWIFNWRIRNIQVLLWNLNKKTKILCQKNTFRMLFTKWQQFCSSPNLLNKICHCDQITTAARENSNTVDGELSWWQPMALPVITKLASWQHLVCNDTDNLDGAQNKAWDHDDIIKWKHFPRYWPFVWGIHRSQSTRHSNYSSHGLDSYVLIVWYVTVQSSYNCQFSPKYPQ